MAGEIHSLPLQWQSRAGLSNVYWKEGRLQDALGERRKAIDIIEAIRSRLLATEQKAGFLAARIQIYKDTARLHLELGQTAQAFEITERGRARALLDLVEGSPEAPTDRSAEFQSQLAAFERVAAARNAAASDPGRVRKAEMELQTATDAYQASLAVPGQSSVASSSRRRLRRAARARYGAAALLAGRGGLQPFRGAAWQLAAVSTARPGRGGWAGVRRSRAAFCAAHAADADATAREVGGAVPVTGRARGGGVGEGAAGGDCGGWHAAVSAV